MADDIRDELLRAQRAAPATDDAVRDPVKMALWDAINEWADTSSDDYMRKGRRTAQVEAALAKYVEERTAKLRGLVANAESDLQVARKKDHDRVFNLNQEIAKLRLHLNQLGLIGEVDADMEVLESDLLVRLTRDILDELDIPDVVTLPQFLRLLADRLAQTHAPRWREVKTAKGAEADVEALVAAGYTIRSRNVFDQTVGGPEDQWHDPAFPDHVEFLRDGKTHICGLLTEAGFRPCGMRDVTSSTEIRLPVVGRQTLAVLTRFACRSYGDKLEAMTGLKE